MIRVRQHKRNGKVVKAHSRKRYLGDLPRQRFLPLKKNRYIDKIDPNDPNDKFKNEFQKPGGYADMAPVHKY